MGQCGDRFRAVSTACASMCPLNGWFAASRAELTDFTVLSFGYSGACGADRFHISIIWVRQRVRSRQISQPYHSGITARAGLESSPIPSIGCAKPPYPITIL